MVFVVVLVLCFASFVAQNHRQHLPNQHHQHATSPHPSAPAVSPEGSNLTPLHLPAGALKVELEFFFCSHSQVAVTLQSFPNR